MVALTESEAEEAPLEWLGALGWSVAHGPDLVSDAPRADRADYGAVVLDRRHRAALARLNSELPASALETRNWAFHGLLVNGVGVLR